MPLKTAHAYSKTTGRYLGQVPLSWFDRFPISHEDPDGNRPDVPRVPLGSGPQRTAQTESATTKETHDAEDAGGPEPQVDLGS